MVQIDLGGQWLLTQAGSVEPIPATVPGCVHLDLLSAHKIANPFYRDNQKSLQWIGETSWTYSRSFPMTAELLAMKHVLLRCEGLDTVADISVNHQPVARTDNMFRTYEFDVKPLLKPGDNSIEITFTPVAAYIKEFIVNAKGRGSSVRGLPNVRKAPYSGGWDFGPKFLTCGIYKKIELQAFNEGRLTHIAVTTNLDAANIVSLDIDAFAEHDASQPLNAEITLMLRGALVAHESLLIASDVGHVRLNVPNPQLWWPNGMGAQSLYELTVQLTNRDGNVIDTKTTRIGLRKIELLPKTNEKPLRLAVNGREMFAKGTDWIPLDMFAPTVTTEQIHRYIADAAAVNIPTPTQPSLADRSYTPYGVTRPLSGALLMKS